MAETTILTVSCLYGSTVNEMSGEAIQERKTQINLRLHGCTLKLIMCARVSTLVRPADCPVAKSLQGRSAPTQTVTSGIESTFKAVYYCKQ